MKIDYLDAIRFCMVNLEFPQSLTFSVVCSYIVVDVMSFRLKYLTESYLNCFFLLFICSCCYLTFHGFRITNDILAMARPSTFAIKEYDVINQFKV